MQFVINGTTYEAAQIEKVTGALALDMARKEPNGPGLGIKSLAQRLEEFTNLGYDDDGVAVLDEGDPRIDQSAVLDSEPHLRALLAFIWVSRRLDGERSLKWADAVDFPIASLEIVPDEDDEAEADEDPQVPADGSSRPAGESDAA